MKFKFTNTILCLSIALFSGVNTAFSQRVESDKSYELDQSQSISIKSIPLDLPNKLTLPIQYKGTTLPLVLEKSSVFGANTKCLIDDGTGKLVEVPMNVERSYLGTVLGHEDYSVSAVITDEGLIANIFRPNGKTIEIKPSGTNLGTHDVKEVSSEHACAKDCVAPKTTANLLQTEDAHTFESQDSNIQPSTSPIYSAMHISETIAMPNSTATLRPTKQMEVLEFELGVEIGSRSFFSDTAYKGKLATAQASAQSIIGNLNSRFLRAAGVRFKLGRVIIRTNASTDPLRNLVTSTGRSENSTKSLEAFRDFWNNNPNLVGNTHDLAVYHVAANPSGLAWVGGVGTARRYGTLGGNGATSWANGTAAHEVGHSFGIPHVDSNKFYEVRPRNNSGTDSAGGRNFFISIMHGSGNHNIGRMALNEANIAIGIRNARRSSATKINNPQRVAPYGVYDEVSISTSENSKLIDVIKNDYDVNNDVLDVRILDKTSFKGGKITLSSATGPGGRNRLKYTPPSANFTGRDFFHYTVFDTTGKTDFGTVYVTQTVGLNPNANEIIFDFGTETSPIFQNAIRVTNQTKNNNFGWNNTSGLKSLDRGQNSGLNALNRDIVFSSQTRTFETKVRNGVWNVLLTFGDTQSAHDRMVVKAEGSSKPSVNNFNTRAGEFLNQAFEVSVRDGKLSLEFSDNGGSDPNWVVARLKIDRLRNLSSTNNRSLVGSVVSFKDINNKFVSSNNGSSPMTCDRNRVGPQERFTVIDAGGGKIALKGNNGKYVTSQNGLQAMICDRGRIGSWEKFTWGNVGGKVTLKANNNKFVSSEGGRFPMNSNRDEARSLEQFNVNVISGKKSFDEASNEKVKLFPNPTVDRIIIENSTKNDVITIYDSLGRLIKEVKAETANQDINMTDLAPGLYFVKINNLKTYKITKE